jgi:hypothetical protein
MPRKKIFHAQKLEIQIPKTIRLPEELTSSSQTAKLLGFQMLVISNLKCI